MAPSDSSFQASEKILALPRFTNEAKLKSAMGGWLEKQVADFFEEGFRNLLHAVIKLI